MEVPIYYDPMLAKLVVHGKSRNEALMRARRALEEMVILGVKTNIPLHKEILRDENFHNGGTNIHYLHKKLGL